MTMCGETLVWNNLTNFHTDLTQSISDRFFNQLPGLVVYMDLREGVGKDKADAGG